MKTFGFIASVLLAARCAAQISGAPAAVADSARATIDVTIPDGKGDVYVDSVYAGPAPIKMYPVRPGVCRIRVISPSAFAWDPVMRSDSMVVQQGEHARLSVNVAARTFVQSIPSSAKVFQGAEEIATTPFIFKTSEGVRVPLTFRKEGFESTSLELPDSLGSSSVVRLKPLSAESGLFHGDVINGTRGVQVNDEWPVFISSATMVVSGVLAAYFKDRANGKFDFYVATQDPSYLAATQRLDNESAAFFAVTQVSFIALAYLFLIQ